MRGFIDVRGILKTTSAVSAACAQRPWCEVKARPVRKQVEAEQFEPVVAAVFEPLGQLVFSGHVVAARSPEQ